ncbi:Histone-lysine N-methyltransferase SETMAR, partial [Dufourea novaeangliae]
TAVKLAELNYEILHGSRHSRDVFPTDHHFLWNLELFVRNQTFPNRELITAVFAEFTKRKHTNFYQNGIDQCISTLERAINSQGEYFNRLNIIFSKI